MKTITFSDSKRPILVFEAEHTELAADDGAYIIQAGGTITFQDTPALEELIQGEHPALLRVCENEDELLQGRFHTIFLTLEETQLVVRLTDCIS